MKIKIIILFLLILVASCKPKQQITKSTSSSKNAQVEQLVNQIIKNQPNFKTANVKKMSLMFNMAEREVNVSATCKVTKDSLIQLSIQPFLGVEVFKADFTTQNIVVIDKMNRRYFEVDYNFLSTKFGIDVDFYSLQSLIFGQFFCVGNKDILIDKCTLNELAGGTKMIRYETETMQQSTQLSASNSIEQVILNAKKNNYKLQTSYTDYLNLNGINFPQKIAFNATNDKSNLTSDFSIMRVEFDKPITFTSSNTDKYTKGDINQLLNK